MKKIRTLVVDDSILFRTFLTTQLPISNPNIEIIGSAINATDAKGKILNLKPDVVTLDVEMPGLSGIDFLKQLLPSFPVPVILCSSLDLRVFDALAVGAVDFVRKPDMSDPDAPSKFIEDLAAHVQAACGAKVRIKSIIAPRETPVASAARPSPSNAAPASPQPSRAVPPRRPAAAPQSAPSSVGPLVNPPIIALGASTGGTETTADILRQLPADIPPMLIVQHMPPGFTKMYADRLNRQCLMQVREAKNGDRLTPGLVLIAPGDQHMRILRMGNDFVVRCSTEEKVSGHCPSVDVLFHSMARSAGRNAIGIILTGMGKDGADGLLAMRKAGAFTIGQDEASCVVYGMPQVAYDIGAVMQQSSCDNIPYVLQNYLKKYK